MRDINLQSMIHTNQTEWLLIFGTRFEQPKYLQKKVSWKGEVIVDEFVIPDIS